MLDCVQINMCCITLSNMHCSDLPLDSWQAGAWLGAVKYALCLNHGPCSLIILSTHFTPHHPLPPELPALNLSLACESFPNPHQPLHSGITFLPSQSPLPLWLLTWCLNHPLCHSSVTLLLSNSLLSCRCQGRNCVGVRAWGDSGGWGAIQGWRAQLRGVRWNSSQATPCAPALLPLPPLILPPPPACFSLLGPPAALHLFLLLTPLLSTNMLLAVPSSQSNSVESWKIVYLETVPPRRHCCRMANR